MKAKLAELRKKLDAKNKELKKALELAGEDIDFERKVVTDHLGASSGADAVEKFQAGLRETEDLGEEIEPLARIESARLRLIEGREDGKSRPVQHPDRFGRIDPRTAALGRPMLGTLITEHEHYRERDPRPFDVQDYGLPEIRATLFQTTDGWPPESIRTGRVEELAARPIEVLDIIPIGETEMEKVVWIRETTRTHAATETSEGSTFAESSFDLTEAESPVRKITDSVPVTDEQLEDVAMVRSYLNSRLTFGIRQRLDYQVIRGNGTSPNLRGILNTTGILTQAAGTDNTPDAVYKAMTKIRTTDFRAADYVLLHPNDWQDVRLLKSADNHYIWGPPSAVGPEMLWGRRVVQTTVLAEGTGLTGAFGTGVMLYERRGIRVAVGFSGTQFVQGRSTIRADLRAALGVHRPASFCQVTGI